MAKFDWINGQPYRSRPRGLLSNTFGVCVISVASAFSLPYYVEAQSSEASPASVADVQQIKTIVIRVIDRMGNPIVGAKVNPWALNSSQGHGSWEPGQYNQTEMVPEFAISGEDGIATIKYPKFDHVRERVQTTGVSILVSHPDFVMTDSIDIDVPLEKVDSIEVKLETGGRLELVPTIERPT